MKEIAKVGYVTIKWLRVRTRNLRTLATTYLY